MQYKIIKCIFLLPLYDGKIQLVRYLIHRTWKYNKKQYKKENIALLYRVDCTWTQLLKCYPYRLNCVRRDSWPRVKQGINLHRRLSPFISLTACELCSVMRSYLMNTIGNVMTRPSKQQYIFYWTLLWACSETESPLTDDGPENASLNCTHRYLKLCPQGLGVVMWFIGKLFHKIPKSKILILLSNA